MSLLCRVYTIMWLKKAMKTNMVASNSSIGLIHP